MSFNIVKLFLYVNRCFKLIFELKYVSNGVNNLNVNLKFLLTKKKKILNWVRSTTFIHY